MPEEKPLSIRLLGPPEVGSEGRGLRFGRKKVLALLCYLAAEGGKRPRRELAELLWPNSEERRARTDLRSALTRLRKALGQDGAGGNGEGVGYLAIDGELLGVDQREVELDLRTLHVAVSLARSETSPGARFIDGAAGRRDLISNLEGALGLYKGEFMEGFRLEDAPEFELWLEAERARWRGIFGELCERVSRLQTGAGRLEEATRTARLWTKHAPFEEDAHRRLVDLLSAAGDGEGALLAYEDFRSTLRKVLEIEPSPGLMELGERLRGEVEARASVGTSLAQSVTAATTTPTVLEVPFAGRHERLELDVSSSRRSCNAPLVGSGSNREGERTEAIQIVKVSIEHQVDDPHYEKGGKTMTTVATEDGRGKTASTAGAS